MSQPDSTLSTLIGSRICHDLISPLGAINNGLELLSMADSRAAGPEIELIGASATSASARIRFFRIAFGAAGQQMVGHSETTSILRELFQGSRLTLDWHSQEPQPRTAVRLAFLAIQCLETGMPYGGHAEVREDQGKWTLSGKADKLNIDPALWGTLAGQLDTSQLRPAHVQFALLPILARDENRSVSTFSDDTRITIEF